jgi:DNA-binding transcriptional LysR family regulator
MNWSDLRAFLAVAQLGSLRQAAELLGVTQPTISRRIKTLEANLGIVLFDRTRKGHELTAAGSQLLPDVQNVETAALHVKQRALYLLGEISETVRVGVRVGETAGEILARGLSDNTDGPAIELVDLNLPASMVNRLPEIVVQHHIPEVGPKIMDRLARRIGRVDCAIYGVPEFAKNHALPLGHDDLAVLPWLGYLEEQEQYVTMRWLRRQMRDPLPVARIMNTALMAVAATSGIGVAVLPCFIGNSSPGLVQLSKPIEALQADYWIVINPDLSRNPPVRAVVDWIAKCFQQADQYSRL